MTAIVGYVIVTGQRKVRIMAKRGGQAFLDQIKKVIETALIFENDKGGN